jgi:hypothetical protein
LQTALRILINTPLWVWPLLAYLIWQGAHALRIRTQPIWRMLIVPLVFFLMDLSRLVTARDSGLEPLLAWGGGTAVCMAGGFAPPDAANTGTADPV